MRVSPRLAWRWVVVFFPTGVQATWCGGHSISLEVCVQTVHRGNRLWGADNSNMFFCVVVLGVLAGVGGWVRF